MAWRHRIALVLLLVLTGIPLGGTLCATMCEPASTQTASHHGNGATCEASSAPSPGPRIDDRSARDCGTHETALPQIATAAPEKADVNARSAAGVSTVPAAGVVLVTDAAGGALDDSVPLCVPLRPARSLVLRV